MKIKNNNLIVLTVFLSFTLIGFSVMAAQVEVTISEASGSYNEVVDVPITIANAENIGSLDIVLTYDPTILQVEDVSKGDINNGMISSNTDTEGFLSLAVADQNGISKDGEVAIISFLVIAKTGNSPLKIESFSVYDTESLEINAVAENGVFSVTELDSTDSSSTPGFGFLAIFTSLLVILVAIRGKKR